MCVHPRTTSYTTCTYISTYTTNATATVLRYCFECFTTIARFVVSPRSVPAAIPLDAPARNLSSFLSLFPLFPLAWLLCRYTDSHASVASVSPRQSTVSPLSFLSLSLSLNLFYSIFLPAHYTARQIIRFAYFLYLSICIPNDFIKRLLSFSRDAFRGIA